jgi:hypothetical protein
VPVRVLIKDLRDACDASRARAVRDARRKGRATRGSGHKIMGERTAREGGSILIGGLGRRQSGRRQKRNRQKHVAAQKTQPPENRPASNRSARRARRAARRARVHDLHARART